MKEKEMSAHAKRGKTMMKKKGRKAKAKHMMDMPKGMKMKGM